MSLNMKWPGSGSAIVSISGSTSSSLDMTPFGIYDLDHDFYTDAPKTAAWCAKRLGYPVIDIEMVDEQFYACFEEATSEYSAQVNQFNIRNNLFLLKGQDNANSFSQKNVDGAGLGTINRISQAYGTMVGVGGDVSIKKAYINLTSQVQKYDLKTSLYSGESSNFGTLLSSSVKRDIMRVYYEATPAITRFFDPYSVGAQGTLNLMSELGFGNYSPAAQFLLMPLYEDVMRMQAIEFNDAIRKSAFTFNIVNDVIEIQPVPSGVLTKMYVEYMERTDFENNQSSVTSNVVADYSNIKYDFIGYGQINEVGKQWIRKYTLALSKELLGAIREKYNEIPIPDATISLDGAALRAEAQIEKDTLIEQLRQNLEELSRKNQFEIQKNTTEYTQDMLRKVPLKLYIG
jgi:hypothetical protein